MAFFGFLKLLPVLLFLFVLMQQDKRDEIISRLPFYAAIIAAISLIGMGIPFTHDFFSVAGRLGGFFQYPNTFALFFLIAELIAVSKQKHALIDYVAIAVLLFGLFFTGSRTVLVLAVLSNIVMLFKKRTSASGCSRQVR